MFWKSLKLKEIELKSVELTTISFQKYRWHDPDDLDWWLRGSSAAETAEKWRRRFDRSAAAAEEDTLLFRHNWPMTEPNKGRSLQEYITR